jgi:hypothetical protein
MQFRHQTARRICFVHGENGMSCLHLQ